MDDRPDPDNPALSIAWILGNTLPDILAVLVRIADALERMAGDER